MKLAVGERNVATNLCTISDCVIEYCFSIWITNLINVFKYKDTVIVTMEGELETIPKFSNGTIVNDFEWLQ